MLIAIGPDAHCPGCEGRLEYVLSDKLKVRPKAGDIVVCSRCSWPFRYPADNEWVPLPEHEHRCEAVQRVRGRLAYTRSKNSPIGTPRSPVISEATLATVPTVAIQPRLRFREHLAEQADLMAKLSEIEEVHLLAHNDYHDGYLVWKPGWDDARFAESLNDWTRHTTTSWKKEDRDYLLEQVLLTPGRVARIRERLGLRLRQPAGDAALADVDVFLKSLSTGLAELRQRLTAALAAGAPCLPNVPPSASAPPTPPPPPATTPAPPSSPTSRAPDATGRS